MKNMLLFSCLLFAPLAFGQQETADSDNYFPQQLKAKDLLIACSSSSITNLGRERQKYCHGFISGVEEAVRLLAQDSSSSTNKICAPDNLTSRNLAKSYTRYAAKKTTDLSKPAAMVVVEALTEDYPCPAKK